MRHLFLFRMPCITPRLQTQELHTWEGPFTVGNRTDLLDSWEIIALLKGIPTVV